MALNAAYSMVASSDTRKTATLAIQKIGQGEAAAGGAAAGWAAAEGAWVDMSVGLGKGFRGSRVARRAGYACR